MSHSSAHGLHRGPPKRRPACWHDARHGPVEDYVAVNYALSSSAIDTDESRHQERALEGTPRPLSKKQHIILHKLTPIKDLSSTFLPETKSRARRSLEPVAVLDGP